MSTSEQLLRRVEKLTAILEVAKAITVEHDLDRLLALILESAARVVDADRCSLYLVDAEQQQLWTKIAQGTSEIRMPIDAGLAGHVARTGETVNLADAYADPRFNRSVDQATGYRTVTMLCVPMRGSRGEVTGVLQALNKVRGRFDAEDEELLVAFGGQAAAAIESAVLHAEISRLFEGFVGASVLAIESRDPTTAGHSGRVAVLTVALARALERESSGPLAGVRFTADQINELRYASLLHDFGKVGVRERVLVKAEKLDPLELEVIRERFQTARARAEAESFRRRLELASRNASRSALDEEERRLEASLKELDELFELVVACNKPTVVPQAAFERMREVARKTFADGRGAERPLLTERERALLSIEKGSLSPEEREEIESHVIWTHRFLAQIPWTRALRGVPEIAYAHHERLDGGGYPRKLKAEAIPLQSRMMAISDVYDALTAADRPYKRALAPEKALDLIEKDVRAGRIDAELFRVFVQAKVFRAVPLRHQSLVP